MKDTAQKLSPLSVALHWAVGVGIIAMLAIGLAMEEFELRFLYPVHKSIGIILLAFIVWRVWWRALNGWPQPLGGDPKWQRIAARATHWVLILGTLIMPLSGIVMSIADGRGLYVFGLKLLAANRDAAGKIITLSEPLEHLMHTVHAVTANLLIAAIALHLGAALWHHLKLKDATLRRMSGRAVTAQSGNDHA